MGADPGPLKGSSPDLGALAAGRWSAWTGLTAGTTLDDAVAQLGPSIDENPHGGMFGGSPTLFHRWGSNPGAPRGLHVWSEGATVVGIEIHQARRDEADGDLEPPDIDVDSGAGAGYRQLGWSQRGLVIHAADDSPGARIDGATVLFALRPFTAEAWLADPLRWWSSTRLPRDPM